MFRTSNPAFRKSDVFGPAQTWDDLERSGRAAIPGVAGADAAATLSPSASLTGERAAAGTMTIAGTAAKTAILLMLCMGAAIFTWALVIRYDAATGVALADFKRNPIPFITVGFIAGLVLAFTTFFKQKWAPVTAPLYALAEGVALGAISAGYAVWFGTNEAGVATANSGMVIQALLGTFGVMGAMLGLYATRIIRPTKTLIAVTVVSTIGIGFTYLATMVLQMFLGIDVPFIHSSGPIGIGFSLFVIGIASLNFVLDFHYIEQGAKRGAPKWAEWYGGFALLVTLVWLYLEILRLLAILRKE